MYAVPTVAVALLLCAALARNGAAAIAVGILLGNWIACAFLSYATGDVTNWIALASIDYASAVILALISTRRWGIVLVALYAGMMVLHVAYSIHDIFRIGLSRLQYFDSLTALAWLQLLAVGGWIGCDAIQAARLRGRTQGGSRAGAVVHKQDGGAA